MHTVLSRKKKAEVLAQREMLLTGSAVKLISSGGHTFSVDRQVLCHDDGPLEVWVVNVPAAEGELRLVRCGQRNDGPWGVEFEWNGRAALPTGRGLWWVHALHASVRLAEHLNSAQASVGRA